LAQQQKKKKKKTFKKIHCKAHKKGGFLENGFCKSHDILRGKKKGFRTRHI
jgi:hypothetical protein